VLAPRGTGGSTAPARRAAAQARPPRATGGGVGSSGEQEEFDGEFGIDSIDSVIWISSLVLGNPWWRLMPVAQQKRRGRGCRSMRCEHAGRSCLMVALPLRSYLEAREAKPREGKPPIEN